MILCRLILHDVEESLLTVSRPKEAYIA